MPRRKYVCSKCHATLRTLAGWIWHFELSPGCRRA